MADGSIVFDTSLDNKTLERQLNSLKRKMQSLNDQIYTKQQQQIPLVAQSKQLAAQLDIAKAKLYEMQTAPTRASDTAIARQKETVQSLQSQWNSVQNRVESYGRSIEESTTQLDIAKEKAGAIENSLAQAAPSANRMAEATEKAHKSSNKFALRLKEVVRSALIFTVISQTLASFREWLTKVIATNEEATTAISQLKAALLTLAQPIISVVIPAFTALVNILTQIISAIANIVSFVFGKTASESAEAAKSLYDQQNALEGVGGAASDAAKSLATFDEINQIGSAGGGGGGGGAAGAIGADFSQFFDSNIKNRLDQITTYVSGALLAIGAILTFSGINIPLGIALMAIGAVGLVSVISSNWNSMSDELLKAINAVLLILSGAFLVIGAILTFSGINAPLGIALMVMGAATLAAAGILNWQYMSSNISGAIGLILTIMMTALLVIGAVMAFSGTFIAQGIALMAVGAAGLAATISLNWSWLKEKLEGTWIGIAALIVGVVLVIIGLVLLFTGAGVPLGIGLLVIGAVTLATSLTANWNWLTQKINTVINEIRPYLDGIALVVIGLVLLFTGVGVPLGLGALLLGGASIIAEAMGFSWSWLLEKLQSAWKDIKIWWNTHIKKYFTLDWWKELGKTVIDGFLSGLKSAWDSVTGWVSDAVGWIKDLFGGANDSIDEVGKSAEAITGYSDSRTPTRPRTSIKSVPALARGTVIPPNREFLAVLGDQKSGTNVEAPLATIEQALINALNRTGYTGGQQEAIFEVDGQTFAKLVYKYNSREGRRVGVTMSEA